MTQNPKLISTLQFCVLNTVIHRKKSTVIKFRWKLIRKLPLLFLDLLGILLKMEVIVPLANSNLLY